MSIQSAETNVQLFETYKSAKIALDSTLNGLDANQVDDVILSLQESVEKQQQIEEAMDFNNVGDIEMDDLEAELKQLQLETETKTETPNENISTSEEIIVVTPTPDKIQICEPTENIKEDSGDVVDESIDDLLALVEQMSVCDEKPNAEKMETLPAD